MAHKHLRFPPHQRHILVPTGPRSATALGVTMYTASKPRPVLAQRALWLATWVAGSRVVRGERTTWTPPIDAEAFAGLTREWTALAGREATGLAVYTRLQSFRTGLVVMFCAGRRSMIVRLRPDEQSMHAERAISAVASGNPMTGVAVPAVLGTGEADSWHWTAFAVMARYPHRPARVADEAMTDQISGVVEAALPRPSGTPAHWRGAHGDLTPWNLRRSGRRTWLIDWEDAGYAPPGADLIYHRAVSSALRRGPAVPLEVAPAFQEARAYWASRVAARRVEAGEDALRQALLTSLGSPG